MRPTFSRFRGGLRVGASFFGDRGAVVTRGAPPRGVVDRVEDLAHPGVDVARIHPAVVAFFEDTASLDLYIESRWRFPMNVVWRPMRWLMRALGQFVLPYERARIVTRVQALDPERDGRSDARAVIRTYEDTGEVMQAVAYGTWQRGEARYMSAAFPMPGGQILGLLRLDAIGEGTDGLTGAALTSRKRGGDDAGVWFVLGALGVPAPLGETLELFAATSSAAPAAIDPSVFPRATIIGRHEQRLFGVRFVTHHYWFRKAAAPADGDRAA